MMEAGFEMKPIGDCVQDISSWNPQRDGGEADICYLDLSSVSQETKTVESPSRILAKDAPSRARQLVRGGDILVSTVRPNLNGVARVPDSFDGATASTGFCVLRPDTNKLLGEYLLHWVKTPAFIQDMTRKATGASYPAVSDRIILESLLPLPPMPEQQRIAAILDQAEVLRSKRRQALAKLDTLTQSLFLDSFGYPRTNPRGWPIRPFAELCENQDSLRIPVKSADRDGKQGAYAYYGASGIIDWVDEYIFDGERMLIAEDGANLVARSTPIAFMARGKYWVNNHAHVVAANGEANLRYLEHFFALSDVKPYVSGSAQPKLNRSNLDRIPVPTPPLPIQNEFAARLEKVEQLRAMGQESLSKMERLFASLQHRAFRGEL